MSWYQSFNTLEAILWWIVAAAIPVVVECQSSQQPYAVLLASLAFVAFGITDLLEAPLSGRIPLWLWGLKVCCGAAIFSARYTWRGWSTFRFRDREFLFGAMCLIAVGTLIALQSL